MRDDRDYRRSVDAMVTPPPEDMRARVSEFVHALHAAYLDQARQLAPADRARLPLLVADPLQVVAAGARHLHVLATSDALPAPVGQEVEVVDSLPGLSWRLRFYDPVVVPELGLIAEDEEPATADVRRVLGIGSVVYHLCVAPGGGLTAHHAQHAGTGLANQHAGAARDLESLRDRLRGREALVDELAVAERAGLHHAVRLLAQALAPDDDAARAVTAAGAAADSTDADVRRALLAAVRRGGPR
jgi:hypothetical protein